MKRLIKKLLGLPLKQKILMLSMMALAGIICLAILLWVFSLLTFGSAASVISACLGFILIINGFLSSLPRSSMRSCATFSYAGGLVLVVAALILLLFQLNF